MRSLLLMVACVLLAGCASTPVPVTDLRPITPITLSCKDTPETREQINKLNSVVDSLKTGRRRVYGDDCPPAPKDSQQQKPTS
jgi:hypothetical protein